MRRRFLAFLAIVLALGLFGCDHASKDLAQHHLQSGSALSLVPGVVELRYTENHDTAFSLSRALSSPNKASILTALAVLGIAFAVGVWWKKRKTATPLEHAGFAAIVGGALGNGMDRLIRGYVVDFIHVSHWPVFNVADIAVSVGVGLLLLAEIQRRRNRPSDPAPQ